MIITYQDHDAFLDAMARVRALGEVVTKGLHSFRHTGIREGRIVCFEHRLYGQA